MEIDRATQPPAPPAPAPAPTSPSSTCPQRRSFMQTDAAPQPQPQPESSPQARVGSWPAQEKASAPKMESLGPDAGSKGGPNADVAIASHERSVESEPGPEPEPEPESASSHAALSVIPPPNTATQTTLCFGPPESAEPSGQELGVHTSKKRRLSPASREVFAKVRDEERKRREEERRKREEERDAERKRKGDEKRRKENEKKRKDAEREEEKRRKEEEKRKREQEREEDRRKKEEEKKRKEDEKQKKARSQMRLNAFFARPPSPKKQLETADFGEADRKISDYEADFPSFFLQSHTKLAPLHRFQRDDLALQYARDKLDAALSSNSTPETSALRAFNTIPYRRRRDNPSVQSVKQILKSIQNSSSTTDLLTKPHKLLQDVRMKVLHFAEDVRPPYQGTFTRPVPAIGARKLSRNAFAQCLPETNYDYDSEAEWDEPEDGEDLNSEGEEDETDEPDEDLAEFLDDDEDSSVKRRVIVTDLEPVSSGLHFEDSRGETMAEFKEYRMEIINDAMRYPIDPFSTAYWEKPKPAISPDSASTGASASARMPPPPFPPSGHLFPSAGRSMPVTGNARDLPRRAFPLDLVAEFRQVVDGSNLTKAGLIEVLKKRFPKISKDVIKDALSTIAVRAGPREAEKKWVLI